MLCTLHQSALDLPYPSSCHRRAPLLTATLSDRFKRAARFFVVVVLLLAGFPAAADTVKATVTLHDAVFVDGGAVSGWFSISKTASQAAIIDDYYLSLEGGGDWGFAAATFIPANSDAFTYEVPGLFRFDSGAPPVYSLPRLYLVFGDPVGANLALKDSLSFAVGMGSGGFAVSRSITGGYATVDGDLRALSIPEPATAVLLAAGVLALTGMNGRKQRWSRC